MIPEAEFMNVQSVLRIRDRGSSASASAWIRYPGWVKSQDSDPG
jgi:hypothetical protein